MKKLLHFLISHFEIVTFLALTPVVWAFMASRKKEEKAGLKAIEKAIKNNMNEPLTLHPEIDPALCAGCGACTKVCPEGDILKLVNHKAVLVGPTKCVGHGECEVACPFDAISLVFGTKTRGADIPRLSGNYETNVPGLYIAGELGGMGLIRNAVKQGISATEDALKKTDPKVTGAQYDLIIVGAGPAGVAGALAATSRQAKYVVIEQGAFGGTIANFPRQKVVMSHPAQMPLAGTMKFQSNKVSKEELLEYWGGLRSKFKLNVSESTRFQNLVKKDDIFHMETSQGTMTAKKVILAMGVRGSPRRLGLPNEDLPKVTYNLLDPEQYQKQSVAVVGGGNAGVEAAQYLAKAAYGNKVTLLVRGASFDRCNEENMNIINDMSKKGLVEIWYNSSVEEIQAETIKVKRDGTSVEIPNNYLFVFAGAELPHKFLMSLGVEIDKKFGEGLGKTG
jgi:thioredoxin reductase (NADPH)